MMLLAFLLVSIQGMLAQNTSGTNETSGASGSNNTSITPIELLNFEQGEVLYTLPSTLTIPDGSVPTWKVDGKTYQEINGTSVSEDGKTITLPLSNKIRNIEVTVPATDSEAEKTFTFQVNPKEYSQDYTNVVANGRTHFYADSYHPYEDGTRGDGSKKKPYLISNDMELARLAHEVTNGYKDKKNKVYSQTYFKLTQDIDLSRGIWTPIGSWKYSNKNFNDYSFFAGKLDGDGHSIKNMLIEWINESGYEASWGLFSRLNGTETSEKGFASVTNLIIDDATLQKKPGFNPVGYDVIKLGTIAGDLTQNAETSNIIIRNSKITDNKEEKYTTNNKYRIGGIVGYLDNSATLRIYNISSDVKMDMHTKITLGNTGTGSITISGGIGAASKLSTQAYTIPPTNIYVHGPAMETNSDNTKCKKARVIAFIAVPDNINTITSMKDTWYYTKNHAVAGTYNYNQYGTEQETDAFGKTFTEQVNQYISDKKLNDKKRWAYSESSKFAFSTIKLKFERGTNDVLTVVDENGTISNDTYDWFVSKYNTTETKVNTEACNPFNLPRQKYAQYVYAVSKDGSLRTSTIEVEAIGITAKLDDKTKPGTYIVNVTNDTKLSNDDLGLTITYDWYNGIDKVSGSTTNPNEFTPTETSHKYKYYCKVTVKSGDNIFFEKNVCASVIVYLCPAGVTVDGKTYAAGKDNLTDDEWGYDPEKPMLTWQGAYKKLSDIADWDENIIVLMGTSSNGDTYDTNKGFNITNNYQGENLLTAGDWTNARENHPELFRNATITGRIHDKDYKGQIEITGSSKGLPIWGDTRFENITFNNNGGDSYKIIYCQYHNLEMGEGIRMTNFGVNNLAYGSIDGAVTTPFHIFGGINNDGRFYPMNTPELIQAYNESMPHGKEGFNITIKSGYYSIISTGGRQTFSKKQNDVASEDLNGVMGTPNLPIKCTITMDIDREWNDKYNEERIYKKSEEEKEELRGNDYDAGAILAGSHEGAMYADVDIIIRSGKLGRVVNGTLGANTKLTLTYNHVNYDVPCNTYMGRANILLDPASSEYKKKDNLEDNARVVVTELYGGSMGRGHTAGTPINNPFYGISNITINGGTFKVLPESNAGNKNILCGIFGAGAGGMNGIGYDDKDATTHTPDKNIAYWNTEKSVMLYGTYDKAKENLVTYHCYNAKSQSFKDIDPRDTQTNITINGGVFGTSATDAIDGIYAGGSGFMGKSLWTSETAIPSKYAGNLYGKKGKTVASLTINGGTFYCKNGIFAGGRGTDYFFSESKKGGTNYSDYKQLGQTYGNVSLNITGGTFHCPIFGGGFGVAYATNKGNNTQEILSNMARLFGKSTVKINGGTFYDHVYGGGDMAQVDETEMYISDNAEILRSVFAGGNGREKITKANDPNWHPDSIGRVIGSTSLTFSGTSAQAPSIYGDIYGGGNLAQVGGDTNINIYGANFAGEIFGGGQGNITEKTTDNNGQTLVITSADVNGNTNIYLAQDPGLQTREKDGNLKDNFSINVIWNRLWDGTKFISWDEDKTLFYGKDKDEDKINKFLNPHNIYGGGNLACTVTGTATVNVQKGMTPYSLLKTPEWKESYDDNKNPHFSVFGGGYGENTSVGNTDVTINVEGDYTDYNGEVDDDTDQLARPHRSKSSKKDMNVFDNSKGVPNFTILSVLGGGYAGTVKNNTKVTVDGNTFLHRVYGGGFGDPKASTAENKTGSIGSNTQVFVKGAYIHGDVFGGGAGVDPLKPTPETNGTTTTEYIYFTDVAKVTGTTLVEISDDAKIYGNVYGGGDIANIGDKIKTPDYTIKPISESIIAQPDDKDGHQAGEFIRYNVENYKTFVNLKGGDIFGEVFGGGKGLKKADAPDYNQVGRINGNTIVHIVNTDAAASTEIDYQNNVVPFVWNNVYGGCAYGTVDGNTLVHVEGGKLGQNIYGGGFGSVPVELTGTETEEEKEKKTRQTVLGKKDAEKDADRKGTYANILGNTQVQIDGGTWIWNRKADTNGNITTWLAAQADSEKICDNIEEFKEITAAILKAKTADEITNEKAKAAIQRITSNKNTQQFFEFTNGTMNSGSFKSNHNIYGGGNRACDVNGEAIVIINHSPLTDVIIKNQDNSIKTLSLFDETSLSGLCWYISSKNTNDPEFSVFGAGFGANTRVASTKVYVQPGARIGDQGIKPVNGISYRYINQNADYKTYTDFEKDIYNDFLLVSKDDKMRYFGSATGCNPGEEGFDPMTFRRYHASRWAWILGLSGFTFQAIHGGGYSGYVTGDTYVETDAQPVCENIYGAGLGAIPYGDITTGKEEEYDFGKVGTSSRIFIKSGFIAQNVYGGGAGIESIYNTEHKRWIDFPYMARVPKTQLHIYGRNFSYTDKAGNNLGMIDRTLIMGSVYGGGDVANVGYEKQATDPDKFIFDEHRLPKVYTSLVNIRGGTIFSQVFAGGKGRLNKECYDYQKLGAIYGNTSLTIDRPVITYPYFNESTKEYIYPWSEEAMKHPTDDDVNSNINAKIIPTFQERIYGGCQNGKVYGNTFMSIYDGQIGHGIYGGGWGNRDTLSVNGVQKIDITSADVTGNTNIMILGGSAQLSSYWNPDTRSWYPASIIDGITYSPQYDHKALKFKVNHNIYGGGNEACKVLNNTYITIIKGFLHANTEVKPGQDKSKSFYQTAEWKEIYYKVGSPHFSIFGGGFGEKAIVDGDTNITIDMVHSPLKAKPNLESNMEYAHFESDYSYMDIVGGGYSGKVKGNTNISGSGGVFCRRVFGGGFYSSVNNTNVNIKAIDCRDVFGGGFMGDVKNSTNVTIGVDNSQTTTTSGNETTDAPSGKSPFDNSDIYIHGNVYGGNDVSGYVNIVLDSKGYFKENNTPDPDSKDPNYKNPGTNIKILGGHIYGNVYGAGNGNYLYANDRNGNTKVTVNEHYPLNPDDPNSEKADLVYTVPMRETMPSIKAASDAAKIVNINSWRPLTNRVNIDITGNTAKDGKIVIDGDVYGGGNSATVQKVYDNDDASHLKEGDIKINIGSYVNIRSVFMGSNGDELFTATQNNDFMNMFQKLNGNIEDYTQELNLADTIDWFNDPSNKAISTLYLPTENEDRPKVYPHLLDLYFHPVETDIQGTLTWNGSATGEGLTDCTIGTFCCGGNRGNMNVYPNSNGNVVDYIFPEGLTITDKIVGGCNNANYDYKGKATHRGGYLLGLAHSDYPFIKLTIKNKFEPKTDEKNNAYMGGNVYGGCYKSGTIKGDVTIDLQSDMLAGKDKTMLENSNNLLLQSAQYASLNVYGAGYGMESYVHGNTHILMGEKIKCVTPTMNGTKFNACGVVDDENNPEGLGVSANFVYGGGQQGNVIGLTNVDILNGHVFRAVTGGSYSGYVYGSTQVKVGYPKYYRVNKAQHKGGRYVLKRTDQKNLGLTDSNDGKTGTPTIKQHIYLLSDELLTQGTYEDIVAIKNGDEKEIQITDENRNNYFIEETETPQVDSAYVHINIDEAVYGGGYSLAQGSSVMANNTTVLKYTKEYNVDEAFTDSQAHLDELNGFPGRTTAGFGGNTVILVGDSKYNEHITISHQEMQTIDLPEGTDLFGYYYKHYDNATTTEYTYRFISLQDKYFYHAGNTPNLEGIRENIFYEYDSEGGIFGDGHLSYAEGFRSADVTGYGFAAHTIDNPKIINTFQRMDILRLEDNCFTLLGARDYTVNEINKMPYSIARVGEIKMVSKEIVYENGCLQAKPADTETDSSSFKYKPKARNYMGLSNNIHYVGAVTSNVDFNSKNKEDKWRNRYGQLAANLAADNIDKKFDGKSYQEVKQIYIDEYNKEKDLENALDDPYGRFQKRNDGTAKNMIGIASGYAMKIQICQVTYDKAKNKVTEKEHYGPIYGVVEMNLINVREDEGGGYVYADNNHRRETGDEAHTKEDFLETTGNFVFPYKEGKFIVDDCFPTGYYSLTSADMKPENVKIHYWYVTGFHYYYNAHITGYTFKSSPNNPITFDSDNKDGLTVLSGLKSNQSVRIHSWKMRSGHPDTFSSDLEYRNYLKEGADGYDAAAAGGYQLYVGGSSDTEFKGATSKADTDKQKKGFSALLSMRADATNETEIFNNTLPSGLTEDAKIAFRLVDKVDNTNTDYFKQHLAEKSLATLILKAPAYEEYTSESVNKPIYTHTEKFYKKNGENYELVTTGQLDDNNTYYQPQTDEFVKVEKIYEYDSTNKQYVAKKPSDISISSTGKTYYVHREYTYTIYLTIEYVQGPTVSGNIVIENCALPGEKIRLRKNLKIEADESFATNGYYWHIGKLKRDAEGNLTTEFEENPDWQKNISTDTKNTYLQGSVIGNDRNDLFAGSYYDKTEDYLDIPAYYFMNGYGVQLAISMTGFDKELFSVPMQSSDTLVVHNYQEMDPQDSKVNLHIPEAIARAQAEPKYFAEPRIYIKNQRDLTAFKKFLQVESNDGGKNAQFILQNDLTIADNIDGTGAVFKGTFHGNGHVLKEFSKNRSIFQENQGQIYNLGLENGNIAADGSTNGGAYHCCFEYNPSESSTPIIYRMNGDAYMGYTDDDFKYGRVAYDLNEYYLRARYSNDMKKADDKAALKYIYDYYANGDYQYAHRSDADTGNNTGITYLRTGSGNVNTPNYGSNLTRHNQAHTIDKVRAQNYVEATETAAESRTGNYLPLFNEHQMNDFLFWGQSLQADPATNPAAITSRQTDYMTNRVYRTIGYYGNTQPDAFHYNAYNSTKSKWNTYVHQSATTAIDFTCQKDQDWAIGYAANGTGKNSIYYPPVADNAQVFNDLIIKDGVTQNLLVYTAANGTDETATTEAYDIAAKALHYDEDKQESLIKGHHLIATSAASTTGSAFATEYLHLVERTPEGVNSEGIACANNNLCVPIPFTVTHHAWYVRKPMYYAEDNKGAWEGICLPFTAQKVKAAINGEITHFYGTPSQDELDKPATNKHTLHHEYWLRGLTGVSTGGNTGVNTKETTATFQRPGSITEGLFQADNAESWDYSFKNDFFVKTYGTKDYNYGANPYYNNEEPHIYKDYLGLTANIPYVVRFPGERYYEFDLSSKFYNRYTSNLGSDNPAQTITFHAYGTESKIETAQKALVIPITLAMTHQGIDGYSHQGTFMAQKVANGTIYGMNAKGTAFEDASSLATVMPFRTYITPVAGTTQARLSAAPSVIRIAETTGIEKIEPDVKIGDDDAPSGNYLTVQPIGGRRIRIESTYATQLQVFTTTGQLCRILDVQPGTATYSGFYPNIYIFGNKKVIVR